LQSPRLFTFVRKVASFSELYPVCPPVLAVMQQDMISTAVTCFQVLEPGF